MVDVKRHLIINDVPHIESEILAYLVEHPEAGDTLKGIVDWWLLEQKIKFQTAKVKEALDQLVEDDFVFKCPGRDSNTHYRINQSKYEEIQALLRQRTEQVKRPAQR
jgi:hypothetical protein